MRWFLTWPYAEFAKNTANSTRPARRIAPEDVLMIEELLSGPPTTTPATSGAPSRELPRRELVGRHDADHSRLEVLDGLEDLGAGVHDERAVVGDRLANRQPAQQEDVERLGLPVGG